MWSFGLLAFEEENMDAVSISRRTTSIPACSLHGGSNFGVTQIGGSITLLSQLVIFFLENEYKTAQS